MRSLIRTLFLLAGAVTAQSQSIPISGKPVPQLSALDTVMQQIMAAWQVPGAALAVTKDGRLVFARGYGYADKDTLEPVQPDSLFRIASISKPFTAAAILKLIEQGKLQLSTPAFSLLTDLAPLPGANVDPRLAQITIQNLLEHTGGWDRNIAGDPPFEYVVTAAQAFGVTPPATPDILIRYMMGLPLQYNPGTTYAYSNFGYIVLGQIIQRVGGQNYEDYVRSFILMPLNDQRGRVGKSLLTNRALDEVKYYDYPGAPLVTSVFPNSPSPTTNPYGGFSVELIAANGGWIDSTMDLLRYADTLNGQLTPNVLQSPPSGFVGYVPPVGNGWGWIFEGSLPGNNGILHLDTGYQVNGRVTWSVLFNTRTAGTPSPDLAQDADNQILTAVNGIASWPSGDLFPTYSGSTSACSFGLPTPAWSASAAAGAGNFSLTDANYCGWTATSNASWIAITSGGSGSDSGTINFSFASNTGGARSGTIGVAGLTFTVNQAAQAAPPPTADSVTPNTGSGASQSFTFKYSSLNGSGYLSDVYALFNGTVNGAGACLVVYDKPSNGFYLYTDAAAGVSGPLAPGAGASLSNSQCTLSGTGSSVTGFGNTLTMILNLTFTASFGGPQNVFLYAADSGGMASGWVNRGTWTVPTAATPPAAESVSPASGSASTQSFTLKYSSVNGSGYLRDVYVLFNAAINGAGACFAVYDKPTSGFYLYNDAGNGLTGPLAPGGGVKFIERPMYSEWDWFICKRVRQHADGGCQPDFQ